jgi:hypothetical protein
LRVAHPQVAVVIASAWEDAKDVRAALEVTNRTESVLAIAPSLNPPPRPSDSIGHGAH